MGSLQGDLNVARLNLRCEAGATEQLSGAFSTVGSAQQRDDGVFGEVVRSTVQVAFSKAA